MWHGGKNLGKKLIKVSYNYSYNVHISHILNVQLFSIYILRPAKRTEMKNLLLGLVLCKTIFGIVARSVVEIQMILRYNLPAFLKMV